MKDELKARAEHEIHVALELGHQPAAGVIHDLLAEIERLEARDAALMTKHGNFKGTGDVELDAHLQERDPAFEKFRDSLPPNYWARYDLTAVRLGWHFGRLEQRAEPVGKTAVMANDNTMTVAVFNIEDVPPDVNLYVAPPAPSVPDGWLRTIDEEMVGAHLGVASPNDSYEEAKKKLNALICWHVAVATDPTVNGGWKLVPIEPTPEMFEAVYSALMYHCDFDEFMDDEGEDIKRIYAAMLAASPEPKS